MPRVKQIKRDFDKRAGHYPLEIRVTDEFGGLLMQQFFANVWDRKSKPEVMTENEWQAPVNIEIWEDGKVYYTETREEVHVPDVAVQLDLSEYFGE